MGRDKALLRLGRRTFLEHLAGVLEGEVAPLVVVLGYHAAEIQTQVRLPPPAQILRNPDYHLGQLSSLHVALRFLREQPVAGALVCLVDHPALSKQVVRTLVARFRNQPTSILIPAWRGRHGHPVLFPSLLFEELLQAPLAEGARAVVRRHGESVEYVEVEEEGILWDVDRPEDYEAIKSRWPSD